MPAKTLRQFIVEHWGKILGGALGLIVGLCILLLGFWRSVLLFLCIAVGVYLGRLFDRHEGIQGILQRIWPDND
ncbi:MAG TPA: DUF2273 domain-containing protein [Oscillospiraceae bacterium]|nr:DUF2273 domain-containing protein [Oscillospiraceae bacterium]